MRKENGALLFSRYRVSVWIDEKVLEKNCANVFALNATEL
jgi:hypothetical protein